jgi:riboflavin synthase
MFTGLIEAVGELAVVMPLPSGKGLRLTIESLLLDPPMALGASLAVDGVCLTIVSSGSKHADVEVGPETLSCTTLGALVAGRKVNLERSMRLGDRLGGHLVQGHVDCVGTVLEAHARAEAWDVRVGMPKAMTRYVIEKGSISVDGISLTVNTLEPDGFWVSLIPHSQAMTTLKARVPGEHVNLEVDLIGKYVERLLGPLATKEHGHVQP